MVAESTYKMGLYGYVVFAYLLTAVISFLVVGIIVFINKLLAPKKTSSASSVENGLGESK